MSLGEPSSTAPCMKELTSLWHPTPGYGLCVYTRVSHASISASVGSWLLGSPCRHLAVDTSLETPAMKLLLL